MKTMPSLLAPAGNMRALQTALRFGADAVYCGAKQYGLRAQANNFDEKQLEEAVRLAHAAGNIDLSGGDHIAGQAGRTHLQHDRIAQWLIAFAAEPQPHVRQGHPTDFLLAA